MESETQKLDALLTNESKEDFESTIRFDQLKTDDEWGVFKNRVQDSKGVVRVFMHPSGLLENKKLENETFEGYKGPQPLGDKPIFFLLRVAEKESAPPIIVFENDNRIDSFCRNVQAIQDKYGDAIAHPLYVLPTLNQYPYPKLSDRNEPIRDGEGWLPEDAYDYCLESMTRFVSALELAGVKKVVIGGTELVVEKKGLNHCVGNFINFFKHLSDAEIKVSLGTIPHGRKELREGGFGAVL